jgi:hypothetical protein
MPESQMVPRSEASYRDLGKDIDDFGYSRLTRHWSHQLVVLLDTVIYYSQCFEKSKKDKNGKIRMDQQRVEHWTFRILSTHTDMVQSEHSTTELQALLVRLKFWQEHYEDSTRYLLAR